MILKRNGLIIVLFSLFDPFESYDGDVVFHECLEESKMPVRLSDK